MYSIIGSNHLSGVDHETGVRNNLPSRKNGHSIVAHYSEVNVRKFILQDDELNFPGYLS